MSQELKRAELEAAQMADFISRGFNPNSNMFLYNPDLPDVYHSANGKEQFSKEEIEQIRKLFGVEKFIFIPEQSDSDE